MIYLTKKVSQQNALIFQRNLFTQIFENSFSRIHTTTYCQVTLFLLEKAKQMIKQQSSLFPMNSTFVAKKLKSFHLEQKKALYPACQR